MKQLRLFIVIVLLSLTACSDGVIAPLHRPQELVVITREGPTTFTADANLGEAGFEHDLATMFAEEVGLPIRFIVASDEDEALQKLRKGDAQLAAAWLTPEIDPALPASQPFAESGSIVVTHEASLPVSDVASLNSKTVYVLAGSRQADVLRELKEKAPRLKIQEVHASSPLDLLEGVAHQRYGAVLVDHTAFDIGANFYPELIGDLEVGPDEPISWLFAPGSDVKLKQKADAFIERKLSDGTVERLKDRYFGHVERLDQADIEGFLDRMRNTLPQYRDLFQEAQARTGIDWRLLAALAYQESLWNPQATSTTGVRGMMMLTTETADRLRVSNRLDARQSVLAGARYLAELRDSLPSSVRGPDRLWMAVAAYNLGLGHMNGARSIASSLKVNPDAWYEMKKVLPLLARPDYYHRLKSGKARGGEAVILVENVRIYADILGRHELAWRPMPRRADGNTELAGTPTLNNR
ncbi:membrane-bound lytic murein transglycosylase MltF [Rhodocyclus tenuis]|uniref:Membrane-bound lytic murein transglycosylase MltF n=1 Tax=Rhodocyclus tenuis TaxID=1066 RepID=A0A6L5JWH9_RHOTE|nr:membrane-bound lytic murein transglycosylase MltF [Rhodocyclus gracilis]